MQSTLIDFRGQPAIRAVHADGSSVTASLQGAQLLSWVAADGIERMYLSPAAVFDGKTAIRGGVPVCCPQFNQRGPLPKHGFMRNLPWEPMPDAGADTVGFRLHRNATTEAIWPHAFEARLQLALAPNQLRVRLHLSNSGNSPWSFTTALHSYLRVDDLSQVRLQGLTGASRWDALRNERHVEAAPDLRFDAEFDSVYTSPGKPLRLKDGARTLEITQSATCSETVVWNPGAALCATLADMPHDGYRHMLCVEAARIDEAVLLAPGAEWVGWQQLTIV
jgi:glucose-6-phosphate 1-epimerase